MYHPSPEILLWHFVNSFSKKVKDAIPSEDLREFLGGQNSYPKQPLASLPTLIEKCVLVTSNSYLSCRGSLSLYCASVQQLVFKDLIEIGCVTNLSYSFDLNRECVKIERFLMAATYVVETLPHFQTIVQ